MSTPKRAAQYQSSDDVTWTKKYLSRFDQKNDSHPTKIPDLRHVKDAVPRAEPKSKRGNKSSYVVYNKRYQVLPCAKNYKAKGKASWYGVKFHGKETSNGETYDMFTMSAAHKTLPLPTYAKVTNLDNGKSVIVRINDRGPFHEDRLIDLSYCAAHRLDIIKKGTGRVEVTAIDPKTWHSQSQQTPHNLPKTRPSQKINPAKDLFLQVGAFRKPEGARKLMQRITDVLALPVEIVEKQQGEKPLYLVHVGPYQSSHIDSVTSQLMAASFPKPLKIFR